LLNTQVLRPLPLEVSIPQIYPLCLRPLPLEVSIPQIYPLGLRPLPLVGGGNQEVIEIKLIIGFFSPSRGDAVQRQRGLAIYLILNEIVITLRRIAVYKFSQKTC